MRNKNIKKIVVVIMISFVMILSMTINTFANESYNTAVTPRWTYISDMGVDMSFVGSCGNVVGSGHKQSSATAIRGTVYLYKLEDDEWVYMDEWTNMVTMGTLVVSGDFVAESGVTYKVEFWVTAYSDEADESFVAEHIDTCP